CSSTSSSRASPARRSSSGSSEPSRHHWGGVLMKLRTLVGIGIAGFIVVGSGGAWYAGGASPAAAQSDQPAVEKGVTSKNLVTSLGGFRGTASVPIVLTGQIVEIAPGGQTGRQRHLVPSYIYVLEGTLITNSEGGPVGVGGVQYHAAGQSYM